MPVNIRNRNDEINEQKQHKTLADSERARLYELAQSYQQAPADNTPVTSSKPVAEIPTQTAQGNTMADYLSAMNQIGSNPLGEIYETATPVNAGDWAEYTGRSTLSQLQRGQAGVNDSARALFNANVGANAEALANGNNALVLDGQTIDVNMPEWTESDKQKLRDLNTADGEVWKKGKLTQKLEAEADKNAEIAQGLVDEGKVSGAAKTTADVIATSVSQVPQMVVGGLINAATGGAVAGASLAYMAASVYGSTYNESVKAGLSPAAAGSRAFLTSAVEVATEKMWDVNKLNGGGAFDDVIQQTIFNKVSDPYTQHLWKVVSGVLSEGTEEFISSIADNAIDAVFMDKYKDYEGSVALSIASDAVTDFAMGAASALLMSAAAGGIRRMQTGNDALTRYCNEVVESYEQMSDEDKVKANELAAKQLGISVEEATAQIDTKLNELKSYSRAMQSLDTSVEQSNNDAVQIVTENQQIEEQKAEEKVVSEMEVANAEQQSIDETVVEDVSQRVAKTKKTETVRTESGTKVVVPVNGKSVVYNTYEGELSDGQTKTNEFAQKTGAKVQYVSNANFNGMYVAADGTILISSELKGNQIKRVFTHELTHHIRQSGLYKSLENIVLGANNANIRNKYNDRATEAQQSIDTYTEIVNEMLANGFTEEDSSFRKAQNALAKAEYEARWTYDHLVEWATQDALAAMGEDVDQNSEAFKQAVKDEMVAKYCEDFLNTQAVVDTIVYENRTLAQKIKDFVTNIITKFKGSNAPAELAELERRFADALKDVQKSENKSEKGADDFNLSTGEVSNADYFNELYSETDDGRLRINVKDVSTEDWTIIAKTIKKLGYDIKNGKDAKDIYSRYSDEYTFNKEQSDALKKAYGINDDGTVSKANPNRVKAAKKEYGTTTDFREAGYLLPDGYMLDFSGKKDGGPAHMRAMDHREIARVFDTSKSELYDSNTQYMNAFIDEGNIRLMESQGVTIGETEPTAKQYTILRRFIDHVIDEEGYFYLDLSNADGYTIESRDYGENATGSRVVNDIKAYFKNGELPYRSEYANFYSTGEVSDAEDSDIATTSGNGYNLSRWGLTSSHGHALDSKITALANGEYTYHRVTEDGNYVFALSTGMNPEDTIVVMDSGLNSIKEVFTIDIDKLPIGEIEDCQKEVINDIITGNWDNAGKMYARFGIVERRQRQSAGAYSRSGADGRRAYKNYQRTYHFDEGESYGTGTDGETGQSRNLNTTDNTGVFFGEQNPYSTSDIADYESETEYLNSRDYGMEDFVEGEGDTYDLSGGELKKLYEYAPEFNGNFKGHAVSAMDITRVLDYVANGNKDVRSYLRNVLEKPMYKAKDSFNKGRTEAWNALKNITEQTGIKSGTEESAAAQWLGEGYKQTEVTDEFGTRAERKQYTLEDLKRDFPDKWEDIVKLEKFCREQYDSYIDRINAVLEKIYPDVEEVQLDKISKAKTKLQNAIDSLTRAKLEQDDARVAYYDVLVNQAFSEFEYQQKRYTSGEYLLNKRLQKRQDYFRHFTEMKQGSIGSILNLLKSKGTLIDPNLVGTSEFTKPNAKWQSFMQHQGKGSFTADAVGGLAEYIPNAEFSIAFNPVISHYRTFNRALRAETSGTAGSNNFIGYLDSYTNDLAGKTGDVDRLIIKSISETEGRKTLNAIAKLNSRATANAVVGNIGTALKQISNIPNGMALVKSNKAWAKGTLQYAASLLGDRVENGAMANDLLSKSVFLTERYSEFNANEFKNVEGMFAKTKEGINKFTSWMLGVGDENAAKLIWLAAYNEALENGAEDPIYDADVITRKAVGGRGVGEIPVLWKNKTVNLLTPFQIEVNNSWQNLRQMLGEKDATGILRLMVGSFVVNRVMRMITGSDILPDLIGVLVDTIEKGYKGLKDKDEEDFTWKAYAEDLVSYAMRNAFGQLVSAFPGVSWALPSIIGVDDDLGEKLFGDSSPASYGAGMMGTKSISKTVGDLLDKGISGTDIVSPLLELAMPAGGKQISRMYNAAQDLGWLPSGGFAGTPFGGTTHEIAGKYTNSSTGEPALKFSIDTDDPWEVAKALLFGSYTTEGGKEYLDTRKNEASYSLTQKGLYIQNEYGIDATDFFDWYKTANADGGSLSQKELKNAEGLTDAQKYYLWDAMMNTGNDNAWKAANPYPKPQK